MNLFENKKLKVLRKLWLTSHQPLPPTFKQMINYNLRGFNDCPEAPVRNSVLCPPNLTKAMVVAALRKQFMNEWTEWLEG